MSIRIYALAKQLKKESKELVDVCKKMGLDGKGSPLASLTDEEAKLVSERLAQSDSKAPSSQSFLEEAEAAPMRKPPILSAPSGKVPVLKPARLARLSELSRAIKSENVEQERSVEDASQTPVVASTEPTASNAPVSEATDVEASNVVASSASDSTETKVEVVASAVENVENEAKSVEPAAQLVDVSVEVSVSKPTEAVAPVEPTIPVAAENVAKSETESVATKAVEEKTEGKSASVAVPTASEKKETVDFVQNVVETKVVETKAVESTVVETPVLKETPKTPSIANQKAPETVPSETRNVPTAEKSVAVQPEKPKTFVAPKETPASTQRSKPFGEKKSPLRDVIDRRDSSRKSRDRDGGRRDSKPTDSRPLRPVPPIPSIFTEQDSRAQILEEMKRPPMITPPRADRVRVFDTSRRPKKEETPATDNSASTSNATGSSSRPSGSKPNVAIHLAPMPPQAPKPMKKAAKEPTPQKPEMRLPPEALRAAARGVSRPLTEHIREQEERRRQGGTPSASGAPSNVRGKDNRDQRRPVSGVGAGFGAKESGDSRFSRGGSSDDRKSRFAPSVKQPIIPIDPGLDFAAAGKRAKKSPKDRGDVENREESRGAKRRGVGDSKRGRGDDGFGSDFRGTARSQRRRDKSPASVVTAPRKGDVVIETPCTVKQFAETTGISVAAVIKKLMELGFMLTLNHSLDVETIELLIVAFVLKATVKKEATLEEQYVDAAFDQADPPESLKPRAPVVTFLGHVDHGKTSLLDRILHLHVVSGEKGGITQHIRAYRVETPGGAVTFVDTPGHEAFTEMRARGANCTDVAVLVVAADDGVMPQTEEAISHAKAAGVPIVVALNKMDLPGVNRDKVVQELASNDLMPSEWGGDVEIVETSAVTGDGVDKLLETLLTVAELNELKANPERAASGVVLEASLQSGEGVVCKALVQNGTLRNGDVVLCGSAYGRVRSMSDTLDPHKKIKEAGPSVPVSLVGLDVAPAAGSKFVVLEDVSVARQIAEERQKREREVELADVQSHVTLENLFERMNSAKAHQTLNVIIRADVRGSIEAIRKELGKLEHPEVKVKILQASVGGVTEADVHLADASDAIIVGFNVVPDEGARALAEKKKVQIRRYDVIYKLTEDVRNALEGMLKPLEQVKELGRALVQRAFNISRIGTIAGCRVMYGVVERDSKVRVIRDSRVIGEYQLETLKREKDDVKEVHDGYECGIKLKNFNDIKEGDVLESYKIEEVARTF